MCVNDRHDMTFAFKMALSPNTTNQKLCCIQIYKNWRKRQRRFLKMVGENESWLSYRQQLKCDAIRVSAEPHSSVGTLQNLRTEGRWFDPRLGQYSF